MAAAPSTATTKAWTYTRGGLPRQALKLTTTHPPPRLLSIASQHHRRRMAPCARLVRRPEPRRGGGDERAPRRHAHHQDRGAMLRPRRDRPRRLDPSPPAAPRFKSGDPVVAFLTLSHMLRSGTGGLQAVVAFPARFAVPVPRGKSPREAAGLLLTGCTAAQQVVEAGVRAGDRVLVFGASGGVGSMAVQIAREAVGAEGTVVGVCSGRNVEMVKGLGADEVIDYTQFAKVEDELAKRFGSQPFDAIVDGFGSQAVYKNCARYLKPGGIYSAAGVHAATLSVGSVLKSGLVMLANAIWPGSAWLGGTGRTWKAVSMMDRGPELMERVVGLFADGKLRVAVDSEWPFEQVLEAYDVLVSGRARGKVIVKVDGDCNGE
ncbi:hypothetical protein B0T22DRAFT_516972 [Podospora appendiculata]|uniref:Enoyl reductase (ER) domain-containing protein n=1 Tax=Podospora appendiculata TaxID=314037 RepID=A0AAE1CA40_9PEZI|nr:hypothetical protein B0T22DRAFT_516972 [Podospora appendiculata]